MTRHLVEHEGIEREYFVHVPDSAATDNVPLLLGLHGYRSSATGFEAVHGLNRHADLEGYIAVYPQGSHFVATEGYYADSRITSWNDLAGNATPSEETPHCADDHTVYPCPPECGSCRGCAWTACYDDLGFLERVLDEVLAEYPIDPDRVYLLGVSNGAMMALQLACQRPQRFAAIAAVIGQLGAGQACAPDSPLPLLHLGSLDDDTVRIDGAAGGDGYIYTSVAETTRLWAAALKCEADNQPWPNLLADAAGVECQARSECAIDGHEVVSCLATDAGHWWPSQRVEGVTATCVMPEQVESMPDRERCPEVGGRYSGEGMALVWNFLQRFEREDYSSTLSATTGDVEK